MGIELDFENLYHRDKAAFSNFVRCLAESLHSRGKILVVILQPKTNDAHGRDGPGAEDYAAIGQTADKVKVMAYDYHWNNSAAGSIAPACWVEQVLAYTVSKVAACKVVLGVPAYGYDWVGSKGRGITFQHAVYTAWVYGAKIIVDAQNGPHYTYIDAKGIRHEVWFEDAVSVATLLSLVNKYGVSGVAIWRLGGEDTNIYTAIRAIFNAGSGL
jgi:spore germination protein YaaH